MAGQDKFTFWQELGNENEKQLYWEDGRQWQVVEYDPATDKNILDRVLRMELLAMY